METRQVICQSCIDGREQECWGLTKDKSWCDSQHYPKDTVILQAQFCQHLRATQDYCPTCGSDFAQNRERDESVDDLIRAFDEGKKGITAPDPETQRDAADNFITNPDDKIEAVTINNKKRSIISRRNKETPSS